LQSNYSLRDLYYILSKALSTNIDKFIEVLKSLSSIKIFGNTIEIKWKGKDALTLASLFDSLNKRRCIIAIDEAQRLRGPRAKEVLNALAHAYDYDRNITFILTGSEVGLLYDFLRLEDEDSPLYGRYCYKLVVERFEKSTAKEFLKRGFKELNTDISEEELEEAITFFDGIPGWLTFFGNEYASGNRKLESIKDIAVRLALKEIKNIVKKRSRRYALVLKAIAGGMDSWSKIKKYVEEKEGIIISSSILSNIINSLEDMSIIKDYKFLDPIYREAALRL
jgi:AAA+ ATPase superfamily predicted ATPase